MVLVDAAVIIDFQRTADPKLAALFQSLPIAICGVTRSELLHGTRNQSDRQNLLVLLNVFHQVPIADALWDAVGDNLATLRAGGLTIPFPDAVLATVAMVHGLELSTLR